MSKKYTGSESGKANRKLIRKQNINNFDSQMNAIFGKKKKLDEGDLYLAIAIKGYNPSRLKYWLKNKKKKIDKKARLWMEKTMTEAVVEDFPDNLFK